jgi:DNA-binding transcriptional MerR regulator
MKTKPVQQRSPGIERTREAATSTALQVKRRFTIGALANATGLRASTIRYYERLGLLPAAPRRHGWRDYGADDVRRVRQLVAARALGFSLRQVKALSATLTDRAALVTSLAAKAADLDARIASLRRSRTKIATLIGCECKDAKSCERL